MKNPLDYEPGIDINQKNASKPIISELLKAVTELLSENDRYDLKLTLTRRRKP